MSVGWTAVNKRTGTYYKRPFCYTTQADSNWMTYLAEDGYTWEDAKRLTTYPSEELTIVIDKFIEDGYGERKLAEFLLH